MNAAARFSQPPQSLMPMAYMARLMVSPKPLSSSMREPRKTNSMRLMFSYLGVILGYLFPVHDTLLTL
jgi:hypothetical protein